MSSPQHLPRCLGVTLNVRNVELASLFYRDVLGFRQSGGQLMLGGFTLRLRKATGRPIPRDSSSHDHWFRHFAIVVRDMPAAVLRLAESNVELISACPQTLPEWNREAGGIKALYFRDPDRHPLELIQFPPGKGKKIWRKPGSSVFQGVDHTAVVVAVSSSGLEFYRDFLGFEVTATSLNFGAEQEKLSGVHDPVVRVTTLNGRGDCGIELLEYERPRDGRPQPADTNSEDLWWAESLIESSGDRPAGTVLRDSDGHGVHLI